MKFLSKFNNYKISNAALPTFIEFENGKYETNDKKEIAIIKSSKFFGVDVFEDKESEKGED